MSSIGLSFMYILFNTHPFKLGSFVILLFDPLKKVSFGKFFIDFYNQSKLFKFEADNHIFYNFSIFGNTCTVYIPVDAATIITN
jgi:hypothetical protein